MNRRLRRVRGITAIDALLLGCVVALILSVLLPQRRVAKLLRNEDDAIADLADLEEREEQHRRSKATDADGDGRGEYATLSKVLGSRRAEFEATGDADVLRRRGYYFAVLLPDRRGQATAASSPEVRTDFAEVAALLVAWPVEPGVTGMRAYARWPGGVLLQHVIDGYPYTDAPPSPNAPLVAVDGSGARPAAPYAREDWRPPIFNAATRTTAGEASPK